MPVDSYPCPQCRVVLRGSDDLAPGDLVQCPRCGTQFTLPDLTAAAVQGPLPVTSAPSRPPPRVPDPDVPFRPRWQERPAAGHDEDYPHPSAAYHRSGGLSADYVVDLGRWFNLATAHYSALLGPAIAYLLLLGVMYVAMAMVPCVGALLILLLLPPLAAGLTVVSLAQLTGRPWTFSDFFSGFQWYGSLLGFTLLVGLLVLPFLAVFYGLLAAAFLTGDEGLMFAAIGGGAALLCAAVYVQARAQAFGWQLIIDRRFDAMEAIRGSWRLTRGHFWGLFGIQLLLTLMNYGGLLACGIGVLFTLPLTSLISSAGYLLVAGTRPPRSGPNTQDDYPGAY
jgi:hypothetical protein